MERIETNFSWCGEMFLTTRNGQFHYRAALLCSTEILLFSIAFLMKTFGDGKFCVYRCKDAVGEAHCAVAVRLKEFCTRIQFQLRTKSKLLIYSVRSGKIPDTMVTKLFNKLQSNRSTS